MALTKKQLTAAAAVLSEATDVKVAIMNLAGSMQKLADLGGDDDQPTIHAILAAAIKESGLSSAKALVDRSAVSCLKQLEVAGMDKATSDTLLIGTHAIPSYKFVQVEKKSAKLQDKADASFLKVLEVIVKHGRPDAIEKRLSAKGFTTSMLEDCSGLVGIEAKDDWSVTLNKD